MPPILPPPSPSATRFHNPTPQTPTRHSPSQPFHAILPPMHSPEPVRWGILGTAHIARKNWNALRNAGNARLVAVASRNLPRAADFIHSCQSHAPFPNPPIPIASYRELLERPDIDAVYLPLPTVPRKQWALEAIANGKHVLLEKPVAASTQDAHEIIHAATSKNLQFMDGVMFMHASRTRQIIPLLPSTIGTPRHLLSQFSFPASDAFLKSDIRTHPDTEPLGCLGDLGWYNIRLALHLADEHLPKQVRGRILRAHPVSGVPLSFSGELEFDNGFQATFLCGFDAANAQWAVLTGTTGTLTLHDFVLPFADSQPRATCRHSSLEVSGCDFRYEENATPLTFDEPISGPSGTQEAAMFREFSRLVQSGHPNPFWPTSSLHTQLVLNTCLHSAQTQQTWLPIP